MRVLTGTLGCEDARIEHEQRHDLASRDRGPERGVIGEAEILTAEPDDRAHHLDAMPGARPGYA